jgi:hemoglobin
MADTLYARLGGYDAIAAVADDLLARLQADAQLGRFWHHRGEDGLRREKQLLVNFLCASAGGPMYYTGRDMKISHRGLGISESDWQAFLGHVETTLTTFEVPAPERTEVLAFVASTKADIVK